MIDYQKLEIAHDLLRKLPFDLYDMALHVGSYNNIVLHYNDKKFISHKYEFDSLDDLITKLQELTKPEPKYKIGQEVFAVNHGDFTLIKLIIEKIECSDTVNEFIYSFQNSFSCRNESKLFPTLEALIEHQIKYWTDELKKLPEFLQLTGKSCQHQDDGTEHNLIDPDTNFQMKINKCKKCGEFYK